MVYYIRALQPDSFGFKVRCCFPVDDSDVVVEIENAKGPTVVCVGPFPKSIGAYFDKNGIFFEDEFKADVHAAIEELQEEMKSRLHEN